MGRRQAYDTSAAVASARDVFWDRGYDGASLPDLERATGLSRSSLYHAFSSKRGLFDAAVQDYLDTVVAPRLAVLTGDDGIDAYFAALAADLPANGRAARRGCLLVNTAAGAAAHDDALAAVVNEYRRTLTDTMRDSLVARGVDDAENRARVLVTMSVGALLQARVDRSEALAIIESARALAASWPSGTASARGRVADGAVPRDHRRDQQ